MEKANGLLWEVSLWEFAFVTVILAGGAAYMTGRAVARAWQPKYQLVINILLLACATRFIHFALFNGTLLSLHYYIVDLIVLLIIAFLAHRFTRTGQIARQYSFFFRRTSPLSWEKKESAGA